MYYFVARGVQPTQAIHLLAGALRVRNLIEISQGNFLLKTCFLRRSFEPTECGDDHLSKPEGGVV